MKIIFCSLLLTVTVFAEALELSPDYTIIINKSSIPSEKTAATELQKFIKKTLKYNLPISDKPQNNGKNILIGQSGYIKEMLPEVKFNQLKSDEIIIKTSGNTLIITGGRPRGTLYAAYSFIEDVLGVKFLTSSATYFPVKISNNIGDLNIHYTPRLDVRSMYYKDVIHQNPLFSARRKINGHFQQIPEKYGYSVSWIGACHTFDRLIPPEKYYKAHPEWFSLRNDKRKAKDSQLCLTNKDMRDELIKNALKWLEKNPHSRIISISQNDNHYFCQCKKCRELDKKEGSHSGSLIHFINYVAAELAKKYPDIRVKTFAYKYSRKPPEFVKPEKNVIIELCSIENFVNRPITHKLNRKFCNDLEAWNKIASQIYIWNYVANFNNYGVPHPNLYFLASNIRDFVKYDKVIRVYEEGDGKNYVGDFNALRVYLLSRIMWNPELRTQDVIDEFLKYYYGKAAPYLAKYLTYIQNLGINSKTPITCFTDDTSGWLDSVEVCKGLKLFDQALKSVKDNPVYFRRVREARLPLYFAASDNYFLKKKLSELHGEKNLLPPLQELLHEIQELAPNRIFNSALHKNISSKLEYKNQKEFPLPKACNANGKLNFDLQEFTYLAKHYGGIKVEDSKASDGIAAMMYKGNSKYWFIKYNLSWIGLFKDYNPFRIYVMVRCDASGNKGTALKIGIYDKLAKKTIMSKAIKVQEVKGENYKLIDLGTYSLSNQMYFFGACPNNSTVKKSYLDRLILVSTKKANK